MRHFRTLTLAAAVLTARPPDGLTAVVQCPDGSPPPCRAQSARALPAPPANSVAVLYFDNLSPDTADAYVAHGLTEAIIVRLSQIERLAVKSRYAVQRFRGTSARAPEALGRALGVAHLVGGSVRRVGNRVRVTVHLVRAASGVQVWGELYDRIDPDVMAIEEDIARAVAGAVTGRLLPAEHAALALRPSRSPQAYEHFLRGHYALAGRNPRALIRAIEEYEAAVRLDPQFSAALARIAYAYALFLDWQWEFPGLVPESVLARGFDAADRALRQDSTASDAWMARGYLSSFRHPRTFEGVREAFERAIAYDPRNAEAFHQYGSLLRWIGEDSAAATALRRALELDPERAITLYDLAGVFRSGRRFAEAGRLLDSVLTIDPGAYYAYEARARWRLEGGDTAGVRFDAEAWMRHAPPSELWRGELIFALVAARQGDRLPARALLERLLGTVAERGQWPVYPTWQLAAALAEIDEPQRALDLLERLEPRGAKLWHFLRSPEFDRIRSDPRFQRLVEESRPR